MFRIAGIDVEVSIDCSAVAAQELTVDQWLAFSEGIHRVLTAAKAEEQASAPPQEKPVDAP